MMRCLECNAVFVEPRICGTYHPVYSVLSVTDPQLTKCPGCGSEMIGEQDSCAADAKISIKALRRKK